MPARARRAVDSFREHEYEHATSDRDESVPDIWRSVHEHRARMTNLDLADLDPGSRVVGLMDSHDRQTMFIGANAEHVTIRIVDPPPGLRAAPVVAGVEVAASRQFVVGTLVLRIPDLTGSRIASESLRLFESDALGERVQLLPSGGAGRAYLWGRICGPGRYAAVGLDVDHVLIRVLAALDALGDLVADGPPRKRRAVARLIVEAALRTHAASDRSDRGRHADLIRSALARGLPAPLFDQEVEPASAAEIRTLIERFARTPNLPELQILGDLRGEAAQL